MNSDYGQIAGNSETNALIYRCFQYLCEEDEKVFVKKFRDQPHAGEQINHTFRELVLGAFLSSYGLKVRHEYRIEGKTPDWCILDAQGRQVTGIVELTNFHIDKATDDDINAQVQAGGRATYWRDGNIDNVGRLWHAIEKKANAYRQLSVMLRIPYVVAVYGDFRADVDFEEVGLCLYGEQSGLFNHHPALAGVLYFKDHDKRYLFRYASNPVASWPLESLCCVFPRTQQQAD